LAYPFFFFDELLFFALPKGSSPTPKLFAFVGFVLPNGSSPTPRLFASGFLFLIFASVRAALFLFFSVSST